MSKYKCTNCGNEQEIVVVEKTITDEYDNKEYKHKVSEKDKCSSCGWTYWKDIVSESK